tara:strand:+ start:2015 stop:2206 length:192 start_codon:yes stop_codon:yes gene_type:complete
MEDLPPIKLKNIEKRLTINVNITEFKPDQIKIAIVIKPKPFKEINHFLYENVLAYTAALIITV